MKRLILACVAVIIIVGAGIGLSFLANKLYSESVALAREDGLREGKTDGHLDGIRDGGEDGYQELNSALYSTAHQSSNVTVNLSSYYYLYNPSLDEVIEYFGSGNYESFDAFHDAIIAKGINSAYVRCYYTDTSSGATRSIELVAFKTVDEGFVVIEPWSGGQVIAVKGELYRKIDEIPDPEIHPLVTRVMIVW